RDRHGVSVSQWPEPRQERPGSEPAGSAAGQHGRDVPEPRQRHSRRRKRGRGSRRPKACCRPVTEYPRVGRYGGKPMLKEFRARKLRWRRRAAFTLIELLVVIAIIAIL